MKSKEENIKDQIIKRWCESSTDISFYPSLSSIYKQIIGNYKFSIDYIETHSELIDWKALSKNEVIPWDLNFISNHDNEWDWEELSKNKGIKHSDELHKKFLNKWDLITLIENGKIFATKDFILKNKKNIGHAIMRLYHPYSFEKYLIKYPFLSDTEVLNSYSRYRTIYSTYKSYIVWDSISEIEILINSKEFLKNFKKHLNWSKVSEKLTVKNTTDLIDILQEFENELDWWSIRHNPCCYESKEILSAFPERMKDWWADKRHEEHILQKKREEYENKIIENLYKERGYIKNEDFETRKFYPNGHFTRGEIKRMLADDNLYWNEELLVSVLRPFYSQKNLFDWWKFSEKTNVNWNIKILNKYKKHLYWRSISGNQSIKWDEVLLDKFKRYIDWSKLISNPCITWNERLLTKYKRYLIWEGSENDESPIYKTRTIYWDVPTLTSLRKIINWKILFNNPDIHWNKEMINSNKYYWYKAFGGGSFEVNYGLSVDWDLTILSKIKYWGIFIDSVGFTNYNNGELSISWLACIIQYIKIVDIEKIFIRKEYLKQLLKEANQEMKAEMQAEDDFYWVNHEKIEQ